MKTIETMARVICKINGYTPDDWLGRLDIDGKYQTWTNYKEDAKAALRSIHDPDPAVVAIVADKLKMDASKVAAIWMLIIEEALK